jgi:hypothetical protein
MSKSGSRFTVFLFNILIALLSVAAVAALFFAPLWEIDVKYVMQKEVLEKILPEEAKEVDLDEIVGDGIPLSLTVSVQTKDTIRSALGKDARQSVTELIKNNVDKVVDELAPTFDEIAEKIVRSTAKSTVRDAVNEQVKNFLQNAGSEATDERVSELLNQAGVDEEYINQKTDALLDAIYAENATVDGVSQKAVETVEEVFEKLDESGVAEFQGAALTEENKEEIKNSIAEALSVIADENGNIDADDLAANLILEMLRSSEDESEPAVAAMDFTTQETDSGSVEEDATEQLKAEVKQMIMEKLTDETLDGIVLALRIVFGVLCFTAFTWAWLIVKMLFKAFSRNPAIKLKLPIWLGWLPFLALVLLPMGAMLLVKAQPSFLVNLLGAEMMESLSAFFASASLSFSSAAWVAFSAAVALIILSIPYGIFRRRLKRAKREDLDEED